MPPLTLAIHPIHDEDSKSSKNKGKLRERHFLGRFRVTLLSLRMTVERRDV